MSLSKFLESSPETSVETETNKRKDHTLWAEKYRPVTMADYIGNTDLKNKIKSYIDQLDIPHLLLHGKAGGGKTTLAKILTKNIDCDYIYINASDENNVDTVRDKIKGFASSVGFKDMKIIILDECLDENTLVWILRDGNEITCKIKDLNDTSDLVKSYNIETDEIQYRPFDLHNIGSSDVYEMELENGEKIICTETHKWYVEDDNGNEILIKTKDIINGKYSTLLTKSFN